MPINAVSSSQTASFITLSVGLGQIRICSLSAPIYVARANDSGSQKSSKEQ